jgi:hypothetical protein
MRDKSWLQDCLSWQNMRVKLARAVKVDPIKPDGSACVVDERDLGSSFTISGTEELFLWAASLCYMTTGT